MPRFIVQKTLAAVCFSVLLRGQDAPLTEDAIARMVKAGLPDDVIVAKIQGEPDPPNLSVDELIALKLAGASDRVLTAVVAGRAARLVPPSQPGATPAPLVPLALPAPPEPPCTNPPQSGMPKGMRQSVLYGLRFENGRVESIRVSNHGKKPAKVSADRFSSSGCLIETIEKAVPAGGDVEVRIDMSQPRPAFGWIRVLSRDKGLSATAAEEVIRGNTLSKVQQTLYSPPLRQESFAARRKQHWRWKADLARYPGVLDDFFINISDHPVQVGFCESDSNNFHCNPLRRTVAPLGQVFARIDPSHRYALFESTTGYSVSGTIRLVEGEKQTFDASSSITFGSPVVEK